MDEALWYQAKRDESQPPPPFYPRDFEVKASEFIEGELGLSRGEITSDKWRTIYVHMIQRMIY